MSLGFKRLTAVGLSPGDSSTVHSYTQTVHRTTQLTDWEEYGPCPDFASYTLAFVVVYDCSSLLFLYRLYVDGAVVLARYVLNIT